MEFYVDRVYDLTEDIREDGLLHVDVMIRNDSGSIESRNELTSNTGINLIFRKKGAVDESQIDPILGLVEEVRDWFIMRRVVLGDDE
jgi:hypothetical protein